MRNLRAGGSGHGPKRAITDPAAAIAVLACAFSLIVSPILILATSGAFQAFDARPENRIFWPALSAFAVFAVLRNRSNFARAVWPPHVLCLLAYLALAGISVLWAFSPDRSLVRFAQQAMIVLAVLMPAVMAGRNADFMRGLYLCFALSLALNLFFVMGGSVTVVKYTTRFVNIGYEGYFEGKNYLGECAAVALLLALHELSSVGARRILAALVAALALVMILLSQSKTALGLAIGCPILAAALLAAHRARRVSPAVLLMAVPTFYWLATAVTHINILDRLAYMLYGDSTLTGRTIIWDFVDLEIARRPILGWGYQSFWLVPNSPTISDAPGWVKMMPNAHNGYYDVQLELGYVGLAILLTFILATIHATGRVADRDPARARLLLSLALFVVCYNYFESLWVRGYEFLWVVFLITAADIAQYPRPARLRRTAVKARGPDKPDPTLPLRAPPLRIRAS